jgi:hypothetical protein
MSLWSGANGVGAQHPQVRQASGRVGRAVEEPAGGGSWVSAGVCCGSESSQQIAAHNNITGPGRSRRRGENL